MFCERQDRETPYTIDEMEDLVHTVNNLRPENERIHIEKVFYKCMHDALPIQYKG